MELDRWCSIPDVEPSGPIIDVAARRGLFYELAWKEVAVLCERAQVVSHLPLQLQPLEGRTWGSDELSRAIACIGRNRPRANVTGAKVAELERELIVVIPVLGRSP
jgi:hypothetical protein